jgi:hypothetical protein
MQRTLRTAPPDLVRGLGPTTLVALVVGLLLVLVTSGHADAGPSLDARLTHADLVATTGGGCGSSCDDDGGDSGGSGSDDDDPDPVGSAYWVTTSQVRRSVDPGVAELIEHVNNYDDRPLDHEYSYRHRTIRSVDFSGGYARFFTLSIGGETDRTVTRTLSKTVDPWESLKIYTRLQTTRYTVYGTRYQDFDDGSREVVSRDSGPYRFATTVLGYVTNPLR